MFQNINPLTAPDIMADIGVSLAVSGTALLLHRRS